MARRRTSWVLPFGGRRMGGSVARYNNGGNKKKRRPWGIIPIPGSGGSGSLYIPPGGGIRPARGSNSSSRSSKRMEISIRPVGTGSSASYYSFRRRPTAGSRILKSSQAPLYAVFNSGSRLTSLQGEQAFSAFSVFTASNLHELYLNTSANQDGSFWLDWCRLRTVFQNQSEANTFLTIYEFATRRDTVQGPVGAFNNGIASIQVGAGSTAADIGATPFMSPRFTANFKILKKYNVELAQGRSHIHTSFYKMSRRYSDSVYQMDSADAFLGTWTRGLFIIAWGSPYNSAATKTNVSTTPVALDIVQNATYASHASLANKSIWSVESDFPTFSDGQIIDIGSGEADTVGDA